ncbi:MAG: D-alanyl-D-alanine carboxypeptidase [Pseudomonadota bacterium]
MHAQTASSRASTLVAPVALAFAAFFLAALLIAHPAAANPKYAGFVYDVHTGKTLYAENADAKRYPASLTKIMTLYVVFEELDARRLTLSTRMRASARAAARPPSKIGIKAGDTIAVRDAIKALVTKSANDVAVVIAEHISGSEAAFAKRMTKTARRLGMKSTTFRNAHGLPNERQMTTARDMARLGVAVQRDFPQYYGVFQTRTFNYGKRRYRNHNKLLGTVQGVDGIKTGYIRASGFNLVTSVRRNGKHIVAVVMGGRSGASRNAHMKDLIGRTLPKAKKRGRDKQMPLLAWNDRGPAPLPTAKPTRPAAVLVASVDPAQASQAATGAPAPAPVQLASAAPSAAQASSDAISAEIMAFADAGSVVPTSAGGADAVSAVIDQAMGNPGFGSDAAASAAAIQTAHARQSGVPRSLSPSQSGNSADATSDGPTHQQSDRFAVAFAVIAQRDEASGSLDALVAALTRVSETDVATSRTLGENSGDVGAESAQLTSGPAGKALRRATHQESAEGPLAATRTSPVTRGAANASASRHGWQIQLGAVRSRSEAHDLLNDAQQKVPSLGLHSRVTEPVSTGRGTLYRARLSGFPTQNEAKAACKRFANHDRPCWAVSM